MVLWDSVWEVNVLPTFCCHSAKTWEITPITSFRRMEAVYQTYEKTWENLWHGEATSSRFWLLWAPCFQAPAKNIGLLRSRVILLVVSTRPKTSLVSGLIILNQRFEHRTCLKSPTKNSKSSFKTWAFFKSTNLTSEIPRPVQQLCQLFQLLFCSRWPWQQPGQLTTGTKTGRVGVKMGNPKDGLLLAVHLVLDRHLFASWQLQQPRLSCRMPKPVAVGGPWHHAKMLCSRLSVENISMYTYVYIYKRLYMNI